MVYEISRAKANVKVKGKDDIQFTITIETEGKVAESFANIDYKNPANVAKVEKSRRRLPLLFK
ncbi:hypothetical protein MUO14_07485 [Halobacillus shinanisalinarum]|uniref:Uncharacterized protein n=1 Tax=Halobacillus shinanisalinarum TaxID=2932258 RepID=A0ABY4H2T6_9BACI|nr:hypothetical protein [Halobacillus shinanisalinarum]UOQ94766.1 hypothetical protein MUO14_07485 [Halobacillus shinanisalinarum]